MMRAMVVAMALALSGLAQAAPFQKGHPPPKATPVTGVVNLNTASLAQLEKLPGVGPSRAKAILAYRHKSHFTKVEQIRQVKGVGRGTFKRIRAHLSVRGPTTLAKVAPKRASHDAD